MLFAHVLIHKLLLLLKESTCSAWNTNGTNTSSIFSIYLSEISGDFTLVSRSTISTAIWHDGYRWSHWKRTLCRFFILTSTRKLLHREHTSSIHAAQIRKVHSSLILSHETHRWWRLWHSRVIFTLFIHLIHVALLLLIKISISISSFKILVRWPLWWILMA